jgi:hypothetical protein
MGISFKTNQKPVFDCTFKMSTAFIKQIHGRIGSPYLNTQNNVLCLTETNMKWNSKLQKIAASIAQ